MTARAIHDKSKIMHKHERKISWLQYKGVISSTPKV